MSVSTFTRLPGDHASYAAWDPAGAVALACSVPSLAVDIETKGLEALAWQITAVSLGTSSFAHVLDPLEHRTAIRAALSAAPELVLHNSPFDVPILYVNGLLELEAVEKVYDTLVTARLAEPSERTSKSLGEACQRHLGGAYGILKAQLEQGFRATSGRSKRAMFAELGWSSPGFIGYAAFDVVMTARLRAALPAELAQRLADHPYGQTTSGDPYLLTEREQTVNRMLLRRSCQGLELDLAVVEELKAEMAAEVERHDRELAAAGVELEGLSAPKVKEAVVDQLEHLGLLPSSHPRLVNGRPSAAAPALAKLHHPIAEALKARSEAERFSRDYADKLLHLAAAADGRLHPRVGVLAARTGRMSYQEPPIQQLPARVRRMLRFDGPATSLDWSSIEPVFFANVVGETRLVEAFEAGGDVYLPVAELAGVDRQTAKVIVLAQLYGQGITALSSRLGVDAGEIVARVRGTTPRIRDAIDRIRRMANQTGKVITLSGRVLPVDPDPATGNRRFFGYQGVNYYVQGSCYDLLAEALAEIHRQGLDDAVYVAVHDELVVATEAADLIERIMLTPPPALLEAAGRTPVLRVGRVDMARHWEGKQ